MPARAVRGTKGQPCHPAISARKAAPCYGWQDARPAKIAGCRAFYNAGSVTVRNVGRVLHVLWLEVTGLLFLLLACVGGAAAVREYHRTQRVPAHRQRCAGGDLRRSVRLFWSEFVLAVAQRKRQPAHVPGACDARHSWHAVSQLHNGSIS